MIINLSIVDFLLLIFCLSAVLFYCFGIYSAITFFRNPHAVDLNFHPPLTILKPIAGLDEDAYENLASFCQQDYPVYQVIFCVQDADDLAIPVIKQIIEDFPGVDIQLVVSDRIIGANLKVSNLANGLTTAKYDILLLVDSDIRVGKDYLQQVIQPFQDESVGIVTCLYRSLAKGWIANLEGIGTSTEFHPGVLVSNQLEGIKFAFGSTIGIKKQVLQAIGGFEAVADYLADDFQFGYLSTQAGYKVVLAYYVVEHVLASSTLTNAINRQIRWARCVRISRPWGYLGLMFTYGTVASILFLITTKGVLFAWAILFIVWWTRLIMGWVVGVNYLQDLSAKQYLWLIPLRDLLSFGIWCCGFFGNTIEWRGQRMKLKKDGKLEIIVGL